MKCNVFIITYLSLHSSALLTKIGSVPTIFASEPCRILVFNWIHRAIKYGLSENHLFPSSLEKNLTLRRQRFPARRNRQEKLVISVSFGSSYIPQFWHVRSHKYGLLYGIFHVPVSRVCQTWTSMSSSMFVRPFPFRISFSVLTFQRQFSCWKMANFMV